MFRFATPWFLLFVPVVIAAAWALARRRRRGDARLVLPQAGTRVRMAVSPWVRIERLVPWLRALVLILIVVSVARPQAGSRIENVSTLGVDIVVALDISGSMKAQDFRPNRLEVARKTVHRFVEGRSLDRIGLVVFAALATTRCPLTLDHEMLGQFLEQVDFAPRDQDGTAMGMGLATAVNRLRESEARSKVVVLVTDGVNNRGQIGPSAAAEAAKALEIRVYTIGVGSEGEAPVPVDYGPLGTRIVMQPVELDEEVLQQIAETTGGQYFRATDEDGLRSTFDTIDELEKTEIESRMRVVYSELFGWALLPGIGLLLVERLLLGSRLRRIP
ncbi:MAG: VWA domain-containing protein [Planctomycetes bacterium]|nr:VWA domain-containing protein [Planctomycetota bacterium]